MRQIKTSKFNYFVELIYIIIPYLKEIDSTFLYLYLVALEIQDFIHLFFWEKVVVSHKTKNRTKWSFTQTEDLGDLGFKFRKLVTIK